MIWTKFERKLKGRLVWVDCVTGSDIHAAALFLESEMNLTNRGFNGDSSKSVAFSQSELFSPITDTFIMTVRSQRTRYPTVFVGGWGLNVLPG